MSANLIASLDSYTNEHLNSWINDIASAPDSGHDFAGLEKHLTQLVAALEVACEDTSAHIGRLIDDVSRGTPRIAYDLHFMREGSLSLQESVNRIQAASNASTKSGASQILDDLHVLDTVKGNMEITREVLREAESWSTLEHEVTSLLTEHNYERAAERLSDANENMSVFQNTPEYDSRRILMISLQNQLEASLSSALVAAIQAQDIKSSRQYFFIFSRIQRESEFYNYYVGSRIEPVSAFWRDARLQYSDLNNAGIEPQSHTLSIFLSSFYSLFLSIIKTERISIPQIFPDPQKTLSNLITSTLSALQPSFAQRLTSVSNHCGATSLLEYVYAFKATEQFAIDVQKVMGSVGYPAMEVETDINMRGTALERTHTRRHSNRISLSERMDPHPGSTGGMNLFVKSASALDTVLEWEVALFEPFLEFQTAYPSMEMRCVDAMLRDILKPDGISTPATTDMARLLRDNIVRVVELADDALGRCMDFTHGYGAAGLIEVLDHTFSSFIRSAKDTIFNDGKSYIFVIEPSRGSQEDLFDLDYATEDWSHIQQSLHLLDSIRMVLERILAFEGKMQTILYHGLSGTDFAHKDPKRLHIARTTTGELQLLAQSALNTKELQDVFKSLHAEAHDQSAEVPSLAASLTPTLNTGQKAPFFFAGTGSAVSEFARACQKSLQDTILSPLFTRLKHYPSSPVWAGAGDPKARRGANASDLQIPIFSLSPSETIQRVAEGLLNLPRLFEVYADDDILAFSIETLPFADAELARIAAEESLSNIVSPPPPRRSPSFSLKQTRSRYLTTEMILSVWLSSLGHSLLSHLTTDVLPNIGSLTSAGALQLASDLGYLENIIQALNVQSDELKRWREYVEMDDVEGRNLLTGKEQGASNLVLSHVAKMRAWTIS